MSHHKRWYMQHVDDNNTAEWSEEAPEPALKRLRLSSVEPDVDSSGTHIHQDQASRLADPAGHTPPPQQLQHCQDSSSYAHMNALLKQLHLEWLQRQQHDPHVAAGPAGGG